MDDKFEQNLNDQVKSSYTVKTTANEILSAYHAQKKTRSYKVPFYSALGAFGCAAIALAVILPMALKTPTTPVVSQDSLAGSISEIPVSPLTGQQDALSYEVSSLYPYLKKVKTPTAGAYLPAKRLAYTSDETAVITHVVSAYEDVEAPIRDAFLGVNESLTVVTGTFVGIKDTYDSKIVLPEVGDLLFKVTYSKGAWESVVGELSDEDKELYTLTGRIISKNGYSNLMVTLKNEAEGDYCTVSQDTSKGKFFFSYTYFEDGELSLSYTLAMLQYNATTPVVVLNGYSPEDETSYAFRVLEVSHDEYSIYSILPKKISLTYINGERTYTYGSIVITED